jgi:hypothetical protein
MGARDFDRWVALIAIKYEPSLLDDEEILRRNVMRFHPAAYREFETNEFETRRQPPIYKDKILEGARAAVDQSTYRIGMAPIVGEYDFDKKGFFVDVRACAMNSITKLNLKSRIRG